MNENPEIGKLYWLQYSSGGQGLFLGRCIGIPADNDGGIFQSYGFTYEIGRSRIRAEAVDWWWIRLYRAVAHWIMTTHVITVRELPDLKPGGKLDG